jgi:integrase/recombinase XerC
VSRGDREAPDESARALNCDIGSFLTHLEKERDVSPNTLRAYRKDLTQLDDFLTQQFGTDWSWGNIDRLTLRGFLGFLARQGLSKRSTARSLSAVRTLFKFLHREELIENNPARAVASPKLEKYLPAWLDRKQVNVLFDMAELRAKEGTFAGVRNLAIIELFYSTGMRLSELRGVNRLDLDLVTQQVKVRGKGRKERIIPVGNKASLALRNYESKRDELARGLGGKADKVAWFLSPQGRRLSVRAIQEVPGGSTSREWSPQATRAMTARCCAARGGPLSWAMGTRHWRICAALPTLTSRPPSMRRGFRKASSPSAFWLEFAGVGRPQGCGHCCGQRCG